MDYSTQYPWMFGVLAILIATGTHPLMDYPFKYEGEGHKIRYRSHHIQSLPNPEKVGLCSEGLELCSEGLGLCSEGLGLCREGVGLCSEGLGLCSEGLGLCSEGLGLCSEGLGLCRERVGLCSEGLGLCSECLGCVANPEKLLFYIWGSHFLNVL